MSKLSKLLAQPKEISIGGEVMLIKPLSVKNIDLILDLDKENKRANALSKIIKITLKGAYPDATEEEVDGVSLKYFKEITEAIMEVNGLSGEGDANQSESKPIIS